MQARRYSAPTPRESILDPLLTRPDWTVGVPRNPKLLWLDKNENTDPEFAEVTTRVFNEVVRSSLAIYPETAPLYHKLGAFLGVGPEQLLLTPGSDGAIRAVFQAFINPGDLVLHTCPTFSMYPVYARMYGARTLSLPYEASPSGPTLSAETVLSAIRQAQPKLVCLPNPDSPTGTVFEPETLKSIIETAGEEGALILVDEAYYPFYDQTALPLIEEFPHLVIARTFAKAWGLAGLRIGYAAACSEVIRLLHKVRPMYEVNTLASAVIERMLDFSHEVQASVRRLNVGRDAFLAGIKDLGLRTFCGKGNFLHVAFGPYASAVHSALQDLVLYRKDFNEPCLKGFSRFTSTTIQRFQPVIECVRHSVLEGG